MLDMASSYTPKLPLRNRDQQLDSRIIPIIEAVLN